MNLIPSTPQGATGQLPVTVVTSLGAHIERCFEDAYRAKLPIIERLLECERQRRGEYSPRMKQLIASTGGHDIFMMLTDIKCRAADAWIKDVVQNHQESTWALEPTVEPDLPPELTSEIGEVVMIEAAGVAAAGFDVDPAALAERRKELEEEVHKKVVEEAKRRAQKMERRITDKMVEGGWKDVQAEFIYDFVTYPAAFLKGPVLRKRKRMEWGPGFRPVVKEIVAIEVDRVSPWDIFPSPGTRTIQEGYLIQRHNLARKAIRSMMNMQGASQSAIREVLMTFRNGHRQQRIGDSEHDELSGRSLGWASDGTIEALEYWGPATGMLLKQWGMHSVNGQPIDELDEYQINAWKVGGHVIMARINPDPLDQRPYSKACFEDIPGQFWGLGLPEMMADVQAMCNAAARSLANNMGIASGPQVEVQVDRLAQGFEVTNMRPWMVWQTTSDRTGNGQPAIRFFQPDMNAGPLLEIYSYFSKIADEVTGVPNYIYGSSAVSGAGRTASGLSMLMENAAKGIKHAIMNLDAAGSQVVRRIYNHLMMFDPDESIKGDMNTVPAGAIGAMIREQQLLAKREFMDSTLNPIDSQIIGPAGRAHMLRETAKGIFQDIDKIVPSEAMMRQLEMEQAAQAQAQAQAAQAAQAQQGQQGQPQPASA